MVKLAIIKKLKNGKYRLYSKKKNKHGKRRNLGTFDSIKGAREREREIQYFKHNADDGNTDSELEKILSDLSNIMAYLEEAGMAGANEISKAMDAIDGSFADDESIPEWEMDESPAERKKEKQYKRHEVPTDPAQLDELSKDEPHDVHDLMLYNKINKELDEVYKNENAGKYHQIRNWLEDNLSKMQISEHMKHELQDRVVAPVWEIFDMANDGGFSGNSIMSDVPDAQMNYPGAGQYEMTGEVAGGTQGIFAIPEATVVAHLIEKLTKLANHLDGIGYFDCADEIDEIAKSLKLK